MIDYKSLESLVGVTLNTIYLLNKIVFIRIIKKI